MLKLVLAFPQEERFNDSYVSMMMERKVSTHCIETRVSPVRLTGSYRQIELCLLRNIMRGSNNYWRVPNGRPMRSPRPPQRSRKARFYEVPPRLCTHELAVRKALPGSTAPSTGKINSPIHGEGRGRTLWPAVTDRRMVFVHNKS
ncbi:hypothetical protein DAEQUDRAFT_479953 [Daedalea quercina L-15889]|uniref:Uncharacterized protein n=1 Tax=Daedalea quercina L-15889 TaxID=1314783 RepID=A0A165MWV4_9APHY|nr:hypothetical protein DAEQUDRAFT_479953 [Daedalea quercina L-15889]